MPVPHETISPAATLTPLRMDLPPAPRPSDYPCSSTNAAPTPTPTMAERAHPCNNNRGQPRTVKDSPEKTPRAPRSLGDEPTDTLQGRGGGRPRTRPEPLDSRRARRAWSTTAAPAKAIVPANSMQLRPGQTGICGPAEASGQSHPHQAHRHQQGAPLSQDLPPQGEGGGRERRTHSHSPFPRPLLYPLPTTRSPATQCPPGQKGLEVSMAGTFSLSVPTIDPPRAERMVRAGKKLGRGKGTNQGG